MGTVIRRRWRRMRVFALHAAKDGRIWVGTDDGLSLYDPQTGKFTNYDQLRSGAAPLRVRSGSHHS